MVCYARPAGCFAAIVAVAWLVFAGPVSHLFGDAATVVAIIAATVGTAVAAVLAFTIFMATRRHRAASGGCVSCRFQCQHAMTEETSGPPGARTSGERSTHSFGTCPAADAGGQGRRDLSRPRWPDRPIHHAVRGPPHWSA